MRHTNTHSILHINKKKFNQFLCGRRATVLPACEKKLKSIHSYIFLFSIFIASLNIYTQPFDGLKSSTYVYLHIAFVRDVYNGIYMHAYALGIVDIPQVVNSCNITDIYIYELYVKNHCLRSFIVVIGG